MLYALFKNIKAEINNCIFECKLLNYNTSYIGDGVTKSEYVLEISKHDLCDVKNKTVYSFVCSNSEIKNITVDNLESVFNIISADHKSHIYFLVNAAITNNSIVCSEVQFITLNNIFDYKKLFKSNGIIYSKQSVDTNVHYNVQALLCTGQKKYRYFTNGTNCLRANCETELLNFGATELKKAIMNDQFRDAISSEFYNYYITNISLES